MHAYKRDKSKRDSRVFPDGVSVDTFSGRLFRTRDIDDAPPRVTAMAIALTCLVSEIFDENFVMMLHCL